MVLKSVLLLALTLVTYCNSMAGEMVFDDFSVVVENPGVRDLSAWQSADRPLTTLSYALNYKFCGLYVPCYKLTNILIHWINGVLLCVFLGTLFGGSGVVPFFGAAVFIVHPVFLQAAGYIAGRSSLLCGMFWLASTLCMLKDRFRKRESQYPFWLIGCVICGVCAWLSKQEAIALPFWLFALYSIQGGRYVKAIAAAALITLIVGYSVVAPTLETAVVNRVLTDAGLTKVLSFAQYFPTYIVALTGYYYAKFFLPIDLTVDPPFSVTPFVSLSFFVALAILGLTLYLYRHSRIQVKTGLLMILVSPLTAYAFAPMGDPIQGHRAYIAGFGFVVLATELLSRMPYRSMQMACAAIVILMFSILTIRQNENVWNRNVTLWEHAAKVNPNKPRAWLNAGRYQEDAGFDSKAMASYNTAVALEPELWAAWSNMAALLMDYRQNDKAEEILKRVVEKSPKFVEARINLGVLRMRQRRLDEAEILLTQAVADNPDSLMAWTNLRIVKRLKEKNGQR